ncbi:MAG: hypothetical protein GEU71_10835 [Actinobacteria bacterium]|nr:hypothetical protein [Actinomycetota bacterium]
MTIPGLLISALRGETVDASGVDPEEFLVACREHRAGGFVLDHLTDGPEGLREALEADAAAAMTDHLRALVDLTAVLDALDTSGIPSLALKGPVLVEAAYGDPRLRPYRDLDLLVDPGDLGRALECIEAAGGSLIDRNWDFLTRQRRGQLHLGLPFGCVLDLHWLPLDVASGALEVDSATLFGGLVPLEVGGVEILTTSPAHTVVHLALHAAMEGGCRLIWLKDLERVVATSDVDWDEVVRTAQAWKGTAAVSLMLGRAARLLDARIPAEVLNELRPPRVRALADRAAVRHLTSHRKNGKVFQLVTRTAGASAFDSAQLSVEAAKRSFRRTPSRDLLTAESPDVGRDDYLEMAAVHASRTTG